MPPKGISKSNTKQDWFTTPLGEGERKQIQKHCKETLKSYHIDLNVPDSIKYVCDEIITKMGKTDSKWKQLTCKTRNRGISRYRWLWDTVVDLQKSIGSKLDTKTPGGKRSVASEKLLRKRGAKFDTESEDRDSFDSSIHKL